MSKNVIVLGLPAEAAFTKLIFSFKGLFRKININRFWLRDLSAVFGANYKRVTVEFTSNAEARKARNFLNNLPFNHGKMEYHLQAEMAEDSMQYGMNDRVESGEQWGRGRRPGKRERPRSRSPEYSREASKLDKIVANLRNIGKLESQRLQEMEIELLRKQRQVIEEERRLLLEQKKLEMIREYGPSASRDLSDFEDLESYESYEPPRKRRHPEPVQAKKRRHTPPPTHKLVRTRSRGLPGFFQPCKSLISEMKQYIDKDTTKEEAEILVKLVRAALRKRLAIALDGKDFMPTRDILNLYREKHPKGEDEAFIANILSNIRASFLVEPKVEKDEVDALKVKQENRPKKEKGDAKDKEQEESDALDKEKAAEGEEVARHVAQDIPENEANGTDTAARNGVINVKSEPDVSQEIISTGNISADVNADVLEIKTNYSMINNTADETEAENKVEDVQTQGESDWIDEQ